MTENRDHRAISYSFASAAVGVIIMRLIVYFVPIYAETYGVSLALDALFSLPTQLIFFLLIPFLIFKFYGKRTFRGVMEYSSAGKFEPYFLLAIPIGIFVWLTTIGISSLWQTLLSMTGFYLPSSVTPKPETFNFGFFVADVLLTAVLPAVCEEFCMRGGALTTAKRAFGATGCIVFCAIAFGLFHQNVKQVFYTACFGALAAFTVIKTKSIYPAMIMHFVNNFCSVLFDYASDYGWMGGGVYDWIDYLSQNQVWALVATFLCVVGITAGLIVLICYMRDKRVIKKKIETVKDSGFDATNGRVVLMGEFSEERVKALEMEREVFGKDYKEARFKPKARDIAVGIGACVLTVLTTLFTYVWGFFY